MEMFLPKADVSFQPAFSEEMPGFFEALREEAEKGKTGPSSLP